MLYYSGNLGGGNPIPMNNYDISKQFKGTIFTLGLIREGCKTKVQNKFIGGKRTWGVKQKQSYFEEKLYQLKNESLR